MKEILKKISPVSGGIILFFFLFVYGLIKNMSISYMGNTSKQMEDFIMSNFFGHIVFFLLKILAVYLAIGLIIGATVHLFIESVLYLKRIVLSIKKNIIINFLISGFVFVIFFFKDLIIYPQAYMNNFYVKNDINKYLTDFLSDNVNPAVFSVIQTFIAIIIIIPVIIAFYKAKKNLFKKCSYVVIVMLILYGAFYLFANVITGSRNTSSANKPNILIFAADALRPDHFSGYGYPKNTTPNIDKLINEGVSFKNAFIEVPRTFPSWVSILTGQFSSTHGIRHMFPTSRDVNRDFKTINKILKQKGYETSVVGDYAGDIFSRIDLGFDNVDTPYFNMTSMVEQIILEAHTGLFPFIASKTGLKLFPVLKDSAYFCPPEFVKDKVIKSIKESKKPFFITTFFSSTHFPYASPYPYYKLFSDKNYSGPYKYYKQRVLSENKDEDAAISGKDIAQIRALYDGGLKAFDDAVGDVLKYLSENGLLDNTIIAVLSDHGENIYENKLGMGHGEHFRGFYAVRIPFIIRYPGLGLKRKEINTVIRHVDFAPTVLSILKEPVPDYMEGRNFLPVIQGRQIDTGALYAFGETGIWFDNLVKESLFFQKQRIMYPDVTFLCEVDFHFDKQIVLKEDYRDLINLAKHRFVFDGRYKLIYMPLKDKVLYEMYDTFKDPEEKYNIAYIDTYNFYRLKKILFDWISRNNDVIIKKDYVFPILRY